MKLLERQLIGLNLSYLTESSRLSAKALFRRLTVLPVEFLRALSVISLLLFLTFINHLPNSVKSTCHLFADDCLLYRQINSKHDTEILQNDLLSLEHWAVVSGGASTPELGGRGTQAMALNPSSRKTYITLYKFMSP